MRLSFLHRLHSSFITTPIFYANGPPHIGHLYSAVLADTAHRWNKLKDPKGSHDFTTGTDEHGSKIARTAKDRGVEVGSLCDEVSQSFQHLFKECEIGHTTFIRTTEWRHRQCVEEMWKRLDKAGCIEKGAYSGWYSMTDECYYQHDDVEDDPAKGSKVSKETRSSVEWQEEQNYMFKLEKFHDTIKTWLKTKDVIQPRHYLPQALRVVEAEKRLSISRDARRCGWGIPVPGDPSQTVYVWLDALCNYLTVAGFPASDPPSPWPPTTQFIGKDILKFHAVYWPAFLLCAGLPLPSKLNVHGHFLVDGVKMSKSVGNVVDPHAAAGVLSHEGLRYFLLKQGLPHDDANFGLLKATNVVNADLINNIANLVSRACATKINKQQIYPYVDIVEVHDEISQSAKPLIDEMNQLRDKIVPLYNSSRFYKAIEEIMKLAKSANGFFQMHTPWRLKDGPKLNTVLYITYEATRVIAVLLQPMTPKLATFCLDRLGVSADFRSLDTAAFGAGQHTGRPLGPDNGVYMERIATEESKKEAAEEEKKEEEEDEAKREAREARKKRKRDAKANNKAAE